MKERRNNFQRMYDIIQVCRSSKKLTEIITKSNISNNDCKKFINESEQLGLMVTEEGVDGITRYKSTDKGLKFCNALEKVHVILGIENQRILVRL